MGWQLLCSGYLGVVDNIKDYITLNKDMRFEKIPLNFALHYIKQNSSKSIPICIEHQQALVIGYVKSLYIKSIPFVDEKGGKEFIQLLVCDFIITNQNFIHALQQVTQYKYNKSSLPIISSDNFIRSAETPPHTKDKVIDVNARLALTQKFPGLSISHDENLLRIIEISICISGYRQMTLIYSVSFDKNLDLCSCVDEKQVDIYKTLFGSNFSLNIAFYGEKLKKDLTRLNLPQDCLVYSSKMYRVNDNQIINSKNNNDTSKDDNADDEQKALRYIQNYLKKHIKEETKVKQKEESSDDEAEFIEWLRQKRLSKKRKYAEEPTLDSSTKPIFIPFGQPCVFEPPLPTQSKQLGVPSQNLKYQYNLNKMQTEDSTTTKINEAKDNSIDEPKTKQQLQSAVSILHNMICDL